MEYGVAAHWMVQLMAFFFLTSICMLSSGTGAVNACRKLLRQAVPYVLSAAPMAAMICLLYTVSCRL